MMSYGAPPPMMSSGGARVMSYRAPGGAAPITVQSFTTRGPAPGMSYGAPPLKMSYAAPPSGKPQKGIVSRALAIPTVASVEGTVNTYARKLKRGASSKGHGAGVMDRFPGTGADISSTVQKVQDKLVMCFNPLLKPLKPFLEGYDIYLYPVYVFPTISLFAMIIMLLWWLFTKGSAWLTCTTWYLEAGILVTALFLHANPDLFITNIRLQYQVNRFKFNNATLRSNLKQQEEKVKGLKASAKALDEMKGRFRGNFDQASAELQGLEAAGKDNIVKYAERFCQMYSDKNADDKISAGEEFNDAIMTMRCIFSGICPDFKEREALLRECLKVDSKAQTEGISVDVFSKLICFTIQPSTQREQIQPFAQRLLSQGQ